MTTLLDDAPPQDAQRWHCTAVSARVDVPTGLSRATRAALVELHHTDPGSLWTPERPGARRRVLGLPIGERTVIPARRPDRYPGELQRDILLGAGQDESTVKVRRGNLLLYGGASTLWQTLIGNGVTTAAQTLTFFNAANAALGVGDSTTGAAASQTDLQASTNKLRVGMDASYPLHTDGTGSGAASIAFRSSFSTSQGNYAWNEWILANSATNATGRSLNRKVESLGTKTNSSVWTLTVTLTLA